MAGQPLVELPTSAIRLIGSGQVITSVFSVVKELVENSVDAGSSSLDIKLDDFGLEKIEISDNGCGIKSADVLYMAKRHYTSKLVSTEDLLSLKTYGFRGEALASLCAVSNMTITTKTANDDVSYVYSLDKEGNVENKKPSHLGTGTTVTARNLFHNLPVRKQYYRTSQKRKEDLKKIEDLLTVFGIIKPKMRITLRHNRDLIFQKTSVNDTKGALHSVLGRPVSSQLLYSDKSITDAQGSVQIYLPKPGSDVKTMSRSTTDRTFIVVNDRPVHVAEFAKVLKQYYCNCHDCDVTRYPVCYVCVKLPTSDVDVNVDPNKTTVFLQHMKEVVTCLEEILLEVYGPLENVPSWHYSDAPKKESNQGREKGSLNEKVSSNMGDQDSTNLKAVIDSVRNPKIIGIKNNNRCKGVEIVPTQESNFSTDSHNNTPLPSFTLTFHQGENSVSSNPAVSAKQGTCDSIKKSNPDTWNNNGIQNLDVTENFPSNVEASSSELSLEDLSSQAFFKDLLDENLALPSATSNSNTLPTDKGPSDFENIDRLEVLESGKGKEADESGTLLTDEEKNSPGSTPLLSDLSEDKSNNISIMADSVNDGDSWRKGHCVVEGKNIQPVQLLAPTSKHAPGKRPPSPSTETLSECPPKQKKMSVEAGPSNQSTLFEIINGQSVKKSVTAFDVFCSEKKPAMLESDQCVDEQQIDERLKKDWENLSIEEKIKYKEKSWQEVKRYEKEVTSARIGKKPKDKTALKSNVRDQVATMASQSQAEKRKSTKTKSLRKRLYHIEKNVTCCMDNLKKAVMVTEAESLRPFVTKPTVIGQAKSCDAWFCEDGTKLCLVNVCRLEETILYWKLRERHILPANPCQSPLHLDSRNVHDSPWQTLEELAKASRKSDTYFHLQDERLVANGFDIKCHIDFENKLKAELIGMCDLIPAYGISDLNEILEIIKKNPLSKLRDARPTKVSYYLQSEAVRMVQQNTSKKLTPDVQDLLDQLSGNRDSALCVHHKPVLHDLFDFADLQPCVDDNQNDMSEGEEG